MLDKVRKIKEEYIRSHLTKLNTYAIKRGTLYGAWIVIPPFGLCGTQIYANRSQTGSVLFKAF